MEEECKIGYYVGCLLEREGVQLKPHMLRSYFGRNEICLVSIGDAKFAVPKDSSVEARLKEILPKLGMHILTRRIHRSRLTKAG